MNLRLLDGIREEPGKCKEAIGIAEVKFQEILKRLCTGIE